MKDRIWGIIIDTINIGERFDLLSPSPKSQPFKIVEADPDRIKIKYLESGNTLFLEKERFISAYKMLKENKGSWVDIGAKRVNAEYGTIEGKIKKEYNGDMSGLSTAPWIASILVNTFENIEFNGKKKGQAIRMKLAHS